MQRTFYLPSKRLYRGQPYSYLWPFSQALAATVSMTTVPGAPRGYRNHVAERLVGLEAYWAPARQPPAYAGAVTPPLGPGGQTFYDDNAWVGLELVRLYRRDHQAAHVRRARQIFDAITASWDADPSHGCPGGVPFSDSPRNEQRNTVTGAPAAELGVRLYQLTADHATLDWAQRMYAWVHDCLLQAGGLYSDHVAPDGTIDTTTWSYNQGTMVGAGVLLWQATHQGSYLHDAIDTAEAAIIHFNPGALHREPPFFVSVYSRNLLSLEAVHHDPGYRQAIRAYSDWAWRHVRQPASGLYTFGPNGTVQLLDQAAMVNINALLTARADSYF